MKYEAISMYSSEHSVRKMCKVLGLKEAGYYKWILRTKKRVEKRKVESLIVKKVIELFEGMKRVYGYRKMQKALEKSGYMISEYKVRKIMRENGLYPVVTKKYKPAKKGRVDGKYFENKVKQKFKAETPSSVWMGDITYIKTKIGFVYLAAVIDLYNREVIGYSISKEIDTELVKAALGNAITKNGLSKGLVFHSDRGCQYSSKSFQNMLKIYGIDGSMGRPACPYDNACMESFFGSAKRECIYRKEYSDIDAVKQDMFEYIELFYNRKRIHAALGYLSPVEYRLSKITA